MTSYVKSTNFASKDSLASGNPLKIIKGTEFDIEFNNIATAIDSKADTTSPVFAGVPTAPTAAPGTNTTQVATTAFVTAADTVAVAAAATAAAAAYPTKTGAGASGTWGINISGNAATATSATSATTATTASNGGVTSVNGATGAVGLGSLVPGHLGVGSVCVFWKSLTTPLLPGSTIAGSYLFSQTAGSGPSYGALPSFVSFGFSEQGDFTNRTSAYSFSSGGSSYTISPAGGTWRLLSTGPAAVYVDLQTAYNVVLAVRIS